MILQRLLTYLTRRLMQLVWHLLLKTATLFDMFKALYLWNNKLINRDNHINDFRKIKKKHLRQ